MSLRMRLDRLEKTRGPSVRRSVRDYSDGELEAIIWETTDDLSDEALEQMARDSGTIRKLMDSLLAAAKT